MTTPYHIKISPRARRQFLALSSKYQRFVIKCLEALAINPRPPGAKKIEGMTGLYGEVIDNMYMLYKVEDQEVLLLAIK